jgi:beta-fructofuranosidase
MSLFFRPGPQAAAADFIPFYWQGDYHLFYLEADRSGTAPEGTPWKHLVTRDFVTFEDWGEALSRGAPDRQDLYAFTGSVVERQGTFYLFYTAHNPHFKQRGRPQEAIMRATSPDLRSWTRDEKFLLAPPTGEGYEPHDWRDPFVFWNAEAGQYWMLLAARRANPGPERRQGLVAVMTSDDLRRWVLREPLWAPDEYYTHECPDLFRVGAWWYLVYSTFSDRMATHYRVASSPRGPWLAPDHDTFDGRAYYAAKTAGDGARRYVFGWLPDRQGDSDEGAWMWGGNLVVHEVVPHPTGVLTVRPPETILAAFPTHQPLAPLPVLGRWHIHADNLAVDSTSRFSVAQVGVMPAECLIETEVSFTHGTQSVGLLLHASDDLTRYYQVRLEPARQRMVIDRWPRPGDQPLMVEQPLTMREGHPVRLRIIADGTCVVAYANDEVALSCRMYDHREGGLAAFVAEGQGEFREVAVKGRSQAA